MSKSEYLLPKSVLEINIKSCKFLEALSSSHPMDVFDKSDFTYKPFLYWIRWILLGLIVTYLIYFFQTDKHRRIDVKTRLWRRFLHINNELFEHLTDSEKTEMFKVHDTTVRNAELFKNGYSDVMTSQTQNVSKIGSKKVTFNLI